MVTTINLEGPIEFADVQTVFNLLYGGDEFVKFYHKEANGDEKASATPWTPQPDGSFRRTIDFKPRLSRSTPAFIRRLIGDDDLPRVKEVQTYSQQGNHYTIQSDLSNTLTSGGAFTIHGETKLSPANPRTNEGCAINIRLSINLEAPLLLKPIEGYVAKVSKAAFTRWLNISRVFCEEKVGLEKEQLMVEEDEIFYDAEEDEEQIQSLGEELSHETTQQQHRVTEPRHTQRTQYTNLQPHSFTRQIWRRLGMHVTHTYHTILSITSSWFTIPHITITLGSFLCLSFLYYRVSLSSKLTHIKQVCNSCLFNKIVTLHNSSRHTLRYP